mmetsp:Transcript_41717/g.100065  ORF Transcript_41717/g.100065 Transcript_41717/m.100065 type:complete len:1039 (+) Transcript_41717:169-3285(+)
MVLMVVVGPLTNLPFIVLLSSIVVFCISGSSGGSGGSGMIVAEAMTIVVAGGGVIGTSVAYYLAKEHNKAVTIIDSVGIAACASGKAGGFLAKDWRDSTPVQELHRYSFDLHQQLADDLQKDGYDIGYRRLTCAAVSVDETRILKKPPSKKLKDVEWVDKGVVGSTSMGTEKTIAQVHPRQLCTAMFDFAKKKVGTNLVIGRVVRALVEEDDGNNHDGDAKSKIKGVELEDGQIIPATQLVIACGPWTSGARSWFDNIQNRPSIPEITGVKCHSILVKSPDRVLNQAVFFESDGDLGEGDLEVYPRPDFDCYVNGFPGEETVMVERPGEEVVEDEAIQLLVDAMDQTSSELGGLDPHTKQVCYWPETSTGIPVIGPLESVSGTFIATGHSVWGILQGPATGKALAELLVNGKASCVDLMPFTIDQEDPSVDDEDGTSSRPDILSIRGGENRLQPTNVKNNNMMVELKSAIETSKKANLNIEMAERACLQWEDILVGNNKQDIQPNILALCQQLYAACLARVGRDQDATSIYDAYLMLDEDVKSREGIVESRLGKAQCLQRLLRYNEAMDEYLEVVNMAGEQDGKLKASWGAALSATRLGNTSKAVQICFDGINGVGSSEVTPELFMIQCLLSCLKYLQGEKQDEIFLELESDLLQWIKFDKSRAASNNIALSRSMKLLFIWILVSLSPYEETVNKKSRVSTIVEGIDAQDLFLDLIQINTSPLDDPDFEFLDDKIELHKLLSSHGDTLSAMFWPLSFIIPEDKYSIREKLESDRSSLWILKSRAGYGSHGNSILSSTSLSERDFEKTEHDEDQLLQNMVEDPLLLVERKFSLRVYCVYFSSNEVYIATEGLVKLAANPFNDTSSLEASVHMTNSGRASNAIQHGLDFLWNELEKDQTPSNADGTGAWSNICNVAAQVLLGDFTRCQYRRENKPVKNLREHLKIPKILGLDFVVDKNRRPWLVEVNRFCGLEPRDESDRNIKYRVVRDAWRKASELVSVEQNISFRPFEDLLDQLPYCREESCLRRLTLHDQAPGLSDD